MARKTRKNTAGTSTGRNLIKALARARAQMDTDLPGAVLTYGKVLSLDPDNAKAMAALRALTGGQRKQLVTACKALLRVDAGPHALALSGILSRANPTDPQFAVFEARAHIILKNQEAGFARIAPFVERHPDNDAVQITYGMALATTKRNARAVDILMPFHQSGKLDPEGINALGASLTYLGRLEEARALLLAAARAGRLTMNGIYNLSRQMDLSTEATILDTLVDTFANEAAPQTDREMAAYALFKAHEDQGDLDTAFQFLLAANILKPDADIQRFMTNIRQAGARAIATEKIITAPALSDLPRGPRPVFIVGMPRSGTTLQEQVLLRHSRVATLGETPQLARVFDAFRLRDPDTFSAADFRAAYFEALNEDQRDADVILDKMPQNTFLAGIALTAMPDARVIHCRRHPMASAFSAFRIRFAEGNTYAYRFDTIAEYYRLSEHLMDHWTSRFPDRIKPVYYEAFTDAPERWIAELVGFCGLDLENGLTDYRGSDAPVHTASLAQVRQKIYRGSSDHWKRYGDHLMPLLAQMIDDVAQYEVELDSYLTAQAEHPVMKRRPRTAKS